MFSTKRNACKKIFSLALTGLLFTTPSLWSEMPQEVFYQAYLTSPEGEPLTSDNVNLQLDFFDQAERGTLMHQVFMQGVDLSEAGGYLNLYIPTRSGKSVLDGDELSNELYLQVTLTDIGNGTPSETLEPRHRFSPVPTALNADMIDGFDSTDFVTVEGTETIKGSKTHLSPLAIRIRERQPDGYEQSGFIVESSLEEPASTIISESGSAIVAISGTTERPETGSVPKASIIAKSADDLAIYTEGGVQITGDLTVTGAIDFQGLDITEPQDLVNKEYVDQAITGVESSVNNLNTSVAESSKELKTELASLDEKISAAETKTNETESRLAESVAKEKSRIDSQAELIKANSEKLSAIETSSNELEKSLTDAKGMIEPIQNSVNDITEKTLPEFKNELNESVTEKLKPIDEKIAKLDSDIDSRITAKVSESSKSLEEKITAEKETANKSVEEANTKISELQTSLDEATKQFTNSKVVLEVKLDNLEKKIGSLEGTSSEEESEELSKAEEAVRVAAAADVKISNAVKELEKLKALPEEVKTAKASLNQNENMIKEAQASLKELSGKIEELAKQKPQTNSTPAPAPTQKVVETVVKADDSLTTKVSEIEKRLVKVQNDFINLSSKSYALKDGDETLKGSKQFEGNITVSSTVSGKSKENTYAAGTFSVTAPSDSQSAQIGSKSMAMFESKGPHIGSASLASKSSVRNVGTLTAANLDEANLLDIASLADSNGIGLLAYNSAALGTAIRAEAPHATGIAMKANGRVEIEGDLILNGKAIGSDQTEGMIIVVPDESNGDGVKLSRALEIIDESQEPISLMLVPGKYNFNNVITLEETNVLISGIAPELTELTFGDSAQIVAKKASSIILKDLLLTGSVYLSTEDSQSKITLNRVVTSEAKPLSISATGFTTASSRPSLSLIGSVINGGIRMTSDADQKTVLQLNLIDSDVYTLLEPEEGLSVQYSMNGGKFWNSGKPLELPEPEDGSIIRDTIADLSYYKGAPSASSPSNLMEEYIVYWRK